MLLKFVPDRIFPVLGKKSKGREYHYEKRDIDEIVIGEHRRGSVREHVSHMLGRQNSSLHNTSRHNSSFHLR